MLPYQEEYIENVIRIRDLGRYYEGLDAGFESWADARRAAAREMRRLRRRNIALLRGQLFPALDRLHEASEEDLSQLDAFADRLMDWKTNLDPGIYVAIHDALLSLRRFRRDRAGTIRELYKFGMGLYYLDRLTEGMHERRAPFLFRNELVFSEAASYLRFYDELDDEATRGYIVRSVANIALCTLDHKKKIAASKRMLDIIRDPHYRELAPGLPWDWFLRGTHQQMSSNRVSLSRGNLTNEELAAVLDSCYEVFKQEETSEEPVARWLWPYYEMEYNCGYVDLKLTVERIERLLDRAPEGQFDMNGLYANVHLPMFYAQLLSQNASLREDPHCVQFLDRVYRRMMKTLLTFPSDQMGDSFFFSVRFVFTNYYEIEGVPTYRDITMALMRRFAGDLYLRSSLAGDLMVRLCDALYEDDPAYFDDIPFLQGLADPAEKRRLLLDYARDCGLYHDFGRIKMNIGRTMQTRDLLDREYEIFRLHTVSGSEDLRSRPSTAVYADIALGHHSWYNGAGGYPEVYDRLSSPYRQMTDVAALAGFLLDSFDDAEPDGLMDAPAADAAAGGLPADVPAGAGTAGPEERAAESFRLRWKAVLAEVQAQSGRRFSPMAAAALSDPSLAARLARLLQGDDHHHYLAIYLGLNTEESVE